MNSVSENSTARFEVEKIGGIDETTVEIPAGVTILSGENATNRTSLLQAIMAAMGSSNVTLKGDADAGRVDVQVGDQRIERTLHETDDGSVRFEGEGLVEDAAIADLFAFLLETNEARQAVANGGDLRALIMRPVDIEDIREEIQQLVEQKGEINDELATIESLKHELPDLEAERAELQSEIEAKRDTLSEKEARIEETNQQFETPKQDHDPLQAKLEELRQKRSDLSDIRRKIDTKEARIERLTERRSAAEQERDELKGGHEETSARLERRINELRNEKRTLNNQTANLQSVIQFNREMLKDGESAVVDVINEAPETVGDVTGQLLGTNETITCWTCGSSVASDDIESMLADLCDIRREKLDEITRIETELDDLKHQKQKIERRRSKREELENTLNDIETKLSQQSEIIDGLVEQRSALTDEIGDLETAVDDLQSEDFLAILDLHKEANQLEFEIEQLESDCEAITEELEEMEAHIRRADDLRGRRAELLDQLSDLRTRIDEIEQESIEQFNEHMAAILETLEYDNLTQIWIERVETTVQDDDEATERTMFELHVERRTERGTDYEDTVEHLSESEREVTGLVFALAGYLVHELHDEVPFMLLDSLEAIDADRIAALVDYFAGYADYLVVALLEEDARAIDEQYNRVHEI